MPFFLYASFPNSRQKNRAPTQQAITYQVPINPFDQPLVKVAESNQNRTYIILKNINDFYNFWYIYATDIVYDPTSIATFGVKDDLLYNTTTHVLYQKQSTGKGTDWVPVSIQDVGEQVNPLQAATLESLQTIYCAADYSGAPDPNATVPVIVDIDEGRG